MSEKIEPVAVVMVDGNICWLKDWLMSDGWVRSNQGDKLYHATTVSALEARIGALESALKGLLEDTQHRDHNCGDEEWCPVIHARAILTGATP